MNQPFQKSSEYYDVLYQHKNYLDEGDYIFSLLQPLLIKNGGELLDIGCGTGNYFNSFLSRNYQITGLDISLDMLNIAKNRFENIEFILGDISEVKIEKKFNLITMLFHVINYQTSVQKLKTTLENVHYSLKPEGLFVFDFWNGSAIVKDPPKLVEKKYLYNDLEIFRTTIPEIKYDKQIIDVNFKFIVKKNNDVIAKFDEVHTMRFLFIDEITNLLKEANLTVKATKSWLKNAPLTDNDWYGVIVAGKA